MLKARYRRITFFFARILLELLFWEIALPAVGLRGCSKRNRSDRLKNIAVRFRSLAIEMGGVMIKVGQFLSTRVDILPPQFTEILEGLQDEVPAEEFPAVLAVIEGEFKRPIDQVFSEFDPNPLAAASLGQAHFARIKTASAELGAEPAEIRVVVKVLRANIDQIVETDLAALTRVAVWLQWYPAIRKRANVPELLLEFSETMHEEMDYIHEGKNAERFAENFRENPRILVPKVYWEYTTRRVITLEDVFAIKISNYPEITRNNIDRADVAKLLFETYLQQIFRDSFFHADPHPGNLFVFPCRSPQQPELNYKLTFIDFGMMGEISPEQHKGLREMAIAVTTQSSARAVRAYKILGFLLPDADLALIEEAGVKVFEKFWGKSTTELREIGFSEVSEFTHQFKDLLYELPFQIPENMLLLGRALSILSGMCTGLDPDFNVWYNVLPYAQAMIREEQNPWESIKAELFSLERKILQLPGRLSRILTTLERGEITTRNPELDRRLEKLQNAVKSLSFALIFAGLLITGTQLRLAGDLTLSWLFLASAGLSLLAWFLNRV